MGGVVVFEILAPYPFKIRGQRCYCNKRHMGLGSPVFINPKVVPRLGLPQGKGWTFWNHPTLYKALPSTFVNAYK